MQGPFGFIKSRFTRSRAVGLAFIFTLVGILAFSWQSKLDLLPSASQSAGSLVTPEMENSRRHRFVKIDSSAIQAIEQGARRIELELFRGERVTAIIEHTESTARGGSSASGHLHGQPNSQVILATFGGAVAANVFMSDGRTYTVTYAGNGLHQVSELRDESSPSLHVPTQLGSIQLERSPDGKAQMMPELKFGVKENVAGFPQFTTTLNAKDPVATKASYGPPVIGFMAVYTPAAEEQCGGLMGIESRIRLSVEMVNAVFKRSGIRAQLRLLWTERIDYSSDGDLVNDLRNVTMGRLPVMMKVHRLRQMHRADLVSLFVESKRANIFKGAGWMPVSFDPIPDYGYSVVEAVFCPSSVFTHEIGHNLGCNHATNDVGGAMQGAFTNSHAWRLSVTNVNNQVFEHKTIMAFGVGNRIPYFSNPNVLFYGVPTGDTNFADNAATINRTAPMVSSYLSPGVVTNSPVNSTDSGGGGGYNPFEPPYSRFQIRLR